MAQEDEWSEEDTIASNVLISRLNEYKHTSSSQGIYPKITEFTNSIRYYAEDLGIDPREAISEYKHSALHEILGSKEYRRFAHGIETYSSYDTKMVTRFQTLIRRTPLAHGFLVNPNRAVAFMEQWFSARDESSVSKDQPTPLRIYREFRAERFNSKFASTGKDYKRYIGRIDPSLVELQLARVFGASEYEVEMLSQTLPEGNEGLPVTAYLSGLGLNRESMRLAINLACHFWSSAKPPKHHRNSSLRLTTPRLDIVTSRNIYNRGLEMFGDVAGDATLAWMILAETENISISALRQAIATTNNVIGVAELTSRGVDFMTACEMAQSDIDPMILDIILTEDGAA